MRYRGVSLAAAATAALGVVATPALAHVGQHDYSGFMNGFAHPIGGADHLLAMFGVGLLAAQLGGRALWFLPIAFVSMMVVGGVIGLSGVELPMVEMAIAASVLVIGALVALAVSLPLALTMCIVGAFALFHGHAHGTELPGGNAPAAYAAGFVVATSLLHCAGIAFGLALANVARTTWFSRAAGGLIAAIGAAFVAIPS